MKLLKWTFNLILLTVFLHLHISQVKSADWTQFRGADGSGTINPNQKNNSPWNGSPRRKWSVDIPGVGWSSPVYSGKHLWVTSAITKAATEAEIAKRFKDEPYPDIKTIVRSVELHAICVDLESGNVLHDLILEATNKPDPVNPLNSYASPTPAIADGKVICHFGSYGTWCLDLETGDTLWKKQYVVDHSVGPGSSPIIWKDRLFLICDGMDQQYVVALDLNTGEELWKTNRPPKRAENPELRKAFSTPIVIQVQGKPQLVAPSAQWMISYDPISGRENWRVDHGNGFSVTPMPIFSDGTVVCASGYTELKLVGIDPTGTGDISRSHVNWTTRNAPAMPSMVAYQGKIYAINDKGILNCVSASTGERITRKRIGGNYSASPILIGKHLYLSSREGKLTVLNCENLEILDSLNLKEPLMASPAIVENDLVLRTKSRLIRMSATW